MRSMSFVIPRLLPVIGVALATAGMAQPAEETVQLPSYSVQGQRVANLEPVGVMAMPISALRFEPRVDAQGRNFAEAQADVTIRGGIFENTGFRIGALPLYDGQTGHYYAEIPIAPDMLGTPEIQVGALNSLAGWNANAGSVVYGWQPIRSGGRVSLSAGEYDSRRGEVIAGLVVPDEVFDQRFGAQIAAAHSESDGSQPGGDHDFERYNARFQFSGARSQTDLFAGYQDKFFGWKNLYTPFASANETEDIQTLLVSANHLVKLRAPGDYFQTGAYYRKNKDDYEFNRFSPTTTFEHTTWVYGAAAEGRSSIDRDLALRYRANLITDEIKSASLIYGPYRTRTHIALGLFPEKTIALSEAKRVRITAGATYDDNNRIGSKVSPLLEVAQENSAASSTFSRIYASYARNSQVPTYTALKSNPAGGLFRGNQNLGRSTSDNFELGTRAALGGWETEAAVFYRRDDDLVDWTYSLTTPNARSANAVDINTTGLELVTRHSWAWLDVVLGYTFLRKDADYGLASVDASFYALNFPEHRLTAAFIIKPCSRVEIRWDNEFRIQEKNTLRRSDEEAVISALGVYWSPRPIKGLQVSLQIDNLWNDDFEEVPAVQAARQQISAGLSYTW